MVDIRVLDFKYDGTKLSEFGHTENGVSHPYGFIICDFDATTGVKVEETGTNIEFNKVSRLNGKSNSLVSTSYTECYTATFDICKCNDSLDWEDREITQQEYTELMRWLNRREFKEFNFIYDDNVTRPVCYYNASFNIEKIKVNDILYGLRLTMETDKPWGVGEEVTKSLIWNYGNDRQGNSYVNPNSPQSILDTSQEIGFIYPNVAIHIDEHASGNFTLYNSYDEKTTAINGCLGAEDLTINGDALSITSSNSSHTTLPDDFNYVFPKIGNTSASNENNFTANIACKITFTYRPVIKEFI